MSITHHHICAVINSEISQRHLTGLVRVLDVGCGNGRMLALLQKQLSALNPGLEFELHGFDVDDSKVQLPGFFERTIETLEHEASDVNWTERLKRISSTESWPYSDGYFDFIVSNQVMEHVVNHDHVFGEIQRTLKEKGVSVHLFPLEHYIYEGHLYLPIVHWIKNQDLLFAWVKLCSRLGMGKYRVHRDMDPSLTFDEYSRRHADYMVFETNYLTLTRLFQITKRNRLRCSFRYTHQFYMNKLRQLQGKPYSYLYQQSKHPFAERALFSLLVLTSSITLVLEKQNRYTR